mmetsp:Transcript_21128/g.37254  ORF Transcript_21128/g.37254 Transcript_21128/m.37254 type:complete len:106 (-) Transcript_21128:465-782(-)
MAKSRETYFGPGFSLCHAYGCIGHALDFLWTLQWDLVSMSLACLQTCMSVVPFRAARWFCQRRIGKHPTPPTAVCVTSQHKATADQEQRLDKEERPRGGNAIQEL